MATLTKDELASIINGLNSITKLELSDKNIADINHDTFELEAIKNVQELSLASNKLKSIDNDVFNHEFAKLKVLDLRKNKIEKIHSQAFYKLPCLERLFLQHNNIHYLTRQLFEKTEKINYLDISCNNFENIKIEADLPNLEILNLSSNEVINIKGAVFKNFPRLKTLLMTENKIEKILETNFEHLTKLEKIDLSNNLISNIEDQSFKPSSKTLKTIVLANNKIQILNDDVFGGVSFLKLKKIEFKSLEILDVSKNVISYVHEDAFSSLKKLQRLDLSSNKIDKLNKKHFENLENLEFLDISDNLYSSIEQDTFFDLKNLKMLNISQNKMESFDFLCLKNSSKLEHLDLSLNQIEKLVLPKLAAQFSKSNKFSYLKTLKLFGNKIENFNDLTRKFESLEVLKVDAYKQFQFDYVYKLSDQFMVNTLF